MATDESGNHLGRYHVREKIGAGGMGTVYRAWDSEIERDVALKWLPAYFSQDVAFVERFRREARTIARLEHPHIVPIYDVGEDEGRPYIIMRLLTGGTLRERIGRQDFDLYALLAAMEQIAGALEAAHARQIVHRDIKPGNILFDDHGLAFLSDFGIAKVLDAATQLTGSGLIGTPAYMSPEQFVGQSIDGRSDEYSLAIVVYEALTGRLPFEGNTAQMMYKHLNAQPPEIDLARYPVPAGLNPVLTHALAKDPNSRYATVTEFVQAMRQVVDDDSAAAAMAALPLATLIQRPAPASAGPVTAPTEVDTPEPGLEDPLQTEYREGLEAMARSDWPTAVAAFGRVLVSDPNYANASEFHAQAKARLSATPPAPIDKTSIELPRGDETEIAASTVAAAAAATAATASVPPATASPAPSGEPVTPPAQEGLPGWVKVAAGAVLLLLLLLGGFFIFRSLGGSEQAAADGDGGSVDALVGAATSEPGNAGAIGADGEEREAATAAAAEETAAAAEEATVAAEDPATHTPAPTATRQPPPTAEPTLAPTAERVETPARVRIAVASANLRRGPGTVYPTAGAVFENDELTLIATNRDESWYLIEREDGGRAWVAASVCELLEGSDLENVPVAATIPPAPTATPVPPTFTPVPVIPTEPPPPPPSDGGGDDGGGDDGGSEPPPIYTAEPP